MAEASVVAGVPDLFFAAKIGETAKQLGVAVGFVQNGEALMARASAPPKLILLDLGAAALEPVELIRKVRAEPAFGASKVIGFANHERIELMEAAREAGCDAVMTRGAFSSGLAGLLQGMS